MQLCLKEKVMVTEEMADDLTSESPNETEEQLQARIQTTLLIADVCMQQGAYHLACKKYTVVCCAFCFFQQWMCQIIGWGSVKSHDRFTQIRRHRKDHLFCRFCLIRCLNISQAFLDLGRRTYLCLLPTFYRLWIGGITWISWRRSFNFTPR